MSRYQSDLYPGLVAGQEPNGQQLMTVQLFSWCLSEAPDPIPVCLVISGTIGYAEA